MKKGLTVLLLAIVMVFGVSLKAHSLVITADFTDLNEQNLGFSPIELDTLFDPTIDFQITNNTGIVWTDFHIRSEQALPPNTVDTYDWFSLNVLDGEVLHLSIISVAGATFYGNPTVDGSGGSGGNEQVPEPSTMLLLGSGLAGLGYVRRKLKK